MDFETITYEKRGQVALLTISREPQLNAINGQASREMQSAWVT